MRKQLRFLSLLAILGCAVYVIGQARLSGGGGGSSPSQTSLGTRVEAPRNALLSLIGGYMVAKQDEYIERANAKGNNEAVTKVILTINYHEMTLKTPEEQRRYVRDTLQIDKWKPGPAWNDVVKAPSLIHELSTVSDEANRKAAQLSGKIWDDSLKPWHDFERKIEAQNWYQQLDESGKRSAMYEAKQKLLTTDEGLRIKAYQTEVHRKGALEVRAMLTPPQQKELDAVLARFDRDMDLAAKGLDPFADKKG